MHPGAESNRTPCAAAARFRIPFRAKAAPTAKSATNITTANVKKCPTSTISQPKPGTSQIPVSHAEPITPSRAPPAPSGRETVPGSPSGLDIHSSPVLASASSSHSADDFIQIGRGNGSYAVAPLPSLHRPFQQTRHRRERQPLDKKPAAAHPDRKRQRNQETQRVKAIHQTAPHAGAKSGAQARNQIPRTVLPGQQVSNPPDSQRA